MVVLHGKSASEGVAFGKLCFENTNNCKPEFETYKINPEDIQKELDRYENSKQKSIEYFQKLYESFDSNNPDREIFKTHELMLQDIDYNNSVINIIKNNNMNAEYAVWETAQNLSKIFENMSDSYLQSRSQDILDISIHIINFLNINNKLNNYDPDSPEIILCSNDFLPSQISQATERNIIAFVSKQGSCYSHSAILLRTMNVPMIVNIQEDLDLNFNDKEAIVDGFEGKIYIDPDENTIQELTKKYDSYKKLNENLLKLKYVRCISKDNKRIKLCANMNTIEELDSVASVNPEGIGLLRSEFIYLNRDNYPSEEEQIEIYKKILKKMKKKEVVIRTLDIGSDKIASYMNFEPEENPALGCRGIRFCFKNPEIFRTQLRALYRASVYGNLSIMFPMISSVKEIREIKKNIYSVCQELKEQKIKFKENIKLGIMIETPVAAILSDRLAQEVDFFSIGTNDLTQYTIAVDRQNKIMNNICEFSAQHAVLRLIKIIVNNAHKYNIPVKICGDLANKEELIPVLVAMNIDELSVAPSRIYKTKKIIINSKIKKFRDYVKNL